MTDNPHLHQPGSADTRQETDGEPVVIRDNRKVDRESGRPRTAGEESQAGAADQQPAAGPAGRAGGDDRSDQPGEVVTGEVVSGDVGPAAGPDGDAAEPVAGGRGGSDGGGDHGGSDGGGGSDAELAKLREQVASLQSELDERTADLLRVTAEYSNYRKRVDRDRTLVAEQATGNVLAALLPVLDDLDRAREHGDLVGPFGAVADQLTAALTKFGLTAFGAKGDPFDPTRHEAVAHLKSPEVTEPNSVLDVMRRGYLLGERLLRAAMVAVADPE